MRNKLLLLIAAVGVLGISSCNKCVECTHDLFNDTDIHCKPENYTNKAWSLTLEELEDAGYECEPLGI